MSTIVGPTGSPAGIRTETRREPVRWSTAALLDAATPTGEPADGVNVNNVLAAVVSSPVATTENRAPTDTPVVSTLMTCPAARSGADGIAQRAATTNAANTRRDLVKRRAEGVVTEVCSEGVW